MAQGCRKRQPYRTGQKNLLNGNHHRQQCHLDPKTRWDWLHWTKKGQDVLEVLEGLTYCAKGMLKNLQWKEILGDFEVYMFDLTVFCECYLHFQSIFTCHFTSQRKGHSFCSFSFYLFKPNCQPQRSTTFQILGSHVGNWRSNHLWSSHLFFWWTGYCPKKVWTFAKLKLHSYASHFM